MKLVLFGLIMLSSVNGVHTSDSEGGTHNNNVSMVSHKRDYDSISHQINTDSSTQKRYKTSVGWDNKGRPSYQCNACGFGGNSDTINTHMHYYSKKGCIPADGVMCQHCEESKAPRFSNVSDFIAHYQEHLNNNKTLKLKCPWCGAQPYQGMYPHTKIQKLVKHVGYYTCQRDAIEIFKGYPEKVIIYKNQYIYSNGDIVNASNERSENNDEKGKYQKNSQKDFTAMKHMDMQLLWNKINAKGQIQREPWYLSHQKISQEKDKALSTLTSTLAIMQQQKLAIPKTHENLSNRVHWQFYWPAKKGLDGKHVRINPSEIDEILEGKKV